MAQEQLMRQLKLINITTESHNKIHFILTEMLSNIPESMYGMGFFAASVDNIRNTKLRKRFTETGTPWTKQS